MSASYWDILFNSDINGKQTTQLYDKQDDFNFSIVNVEIYMYHHCLHMGPCVSQLIRYARTCSAYCLGHIVTERVAGFATGKISRMIAENPAGHG